MHQQQSSPVAPGTILAGKYRVIRVIGRGGMGIVVEAVHEQLQERVAMKFLLPEFAARPEFAQRFVREAQAAVRIKGEHVTRVSDVGTFDNGAPYMVMEFLEGSDLSDYLQSRGRLPLDEAVGYVLQACEAIAEAHNAGIVHRDIKPANLFLARRSDGSSIVKVLDFGISKVIGATDGLTKTTATMGSALYMAPEQMRDAKSVDHRADIYALGVTLYELLAGTQPYRADTLPELCALILTGVPTPLREVRPDLPPPFAAVLERAYERERVARYQTVAELVFALAPFGPAWARSSVERVARFAGVAPHAIPAQTVFGAPLGAPAAQGVAGAATATAMVRDPNGARPKKSGGLVALAVLGLLGVAGVIGFFVFTSQSKDTSTASTDSAETSEATESPAASPTNAATTETAAASIAQPSATSPSSSAAADASASSSASVAPATSVATAPTTVRPTSRPPNIKTSTPPPPTQPPPPPPPPTSKPGSIFDHR